MANTDPVSGLMASMARVRGRKPDGLAAGATTATQAGTVLPTPKPVEPVSMPKASSFEQVLPAPQTAQEPLPTPIPQPMAETPSISPTEPLTGTEEDDPTILSRVTSKLMDSGDGYDLTDAYVLSLGYLYGIPK
jgi:hypothetical protein